MCNARLVHGSQFHINRFLLDQANYWRDPRPSMRDLYLQYSQLAIWGNERSVKNTTLNQNWARTRHFVWVKADQDTMVWPSQGEHWGAPNPQDWRGDILPMEKTAWYLQDSFGLRASDKAGKNHFESFDGDHLQFTLQELKRWVEIYLDASSNW